MRSSAISLALAVGLLALMGLSARQAVLEIWPARMQELMLSSGDRAFLPATGRAPELEVIAASHPHSLIALEWPDGRVEHGFFVRQDTDSGQWWMELGSGLVLIEPTTLRRHYRPNAMSPIERLSLLVRRLVERRAAHGLDPAPAGRLKNSEISGESDDF